ncbi:methylation site containing protein [Pseudomonas sp. WN033]|nr:methylation site containing protein [Pseudomonas sp. WN033]
MRSTKGFTLIELMIVVIVIAILAAIAYPSYTEYVNKSRRADGQAALMQIELEQQKRRAAGLAYSAMTATSPDGHYSVTTTVNGNSYVATAAPQGAQVGDSCGNITITVNNGTSTYGPNDKCWGK